MYELSKTIKSYNKQVKWHSAKFDIYDLSKYLLKFIRLLKGKKILDFGCGNGRDLEFFHKNNFDVIGIDYSDKIIKDDYGNEVRFFSFFKKDELVKKLKFIGIL